jgi:hypothetical protein
MCFIGYAASGPAMTLFQIRRRRRERKQADDDRRDVV